MTIECDLTLNIASAIAVIIIGVLIYYLPEIISGLHEWRRMND